MNFLDFKSIKIFFEFVKEHHYTFYIIFFIGYVVSCYIYFYHFFSRFDFDYIQYFSLLEILKLSGFDTLKVFGISVLIPLSISLFSLYITYFFFKSSFLDIEKELDLLDKQIDNINEQNENELKEIESIEKGIEEGTSKKEVHNRNLMQRIITIKNKANKNKQNLEFRKNEIVELKENLKVKFSLLNLLIFAVSFIGHNYTNSKTFVKKHEYPTVTISFIEENKTQDYKLLGNLETSIILSDEKLTNLEIIEKSNILSINIKSNESLNQLGSEVNANNSKSNIQNNTLQESQNK